jgi:nitroimidazol reductase NimA-like FMN-containing flavoprotein (pyridoxamine 5'-phosphate oxidase superfamily)
MENIDSLEHRGQMVRKVRQMPDADAREFLKKQKTAHVGTSNEAGWPYVVPLLYIYEGGESLFVHTGGHYGHFLYNLERNPRACMEVSDIGPMHQGAGTACDAALVYTSVITFGPIRIIRDDREKKTWFLDQLMAKHADQSWTFEPGYPQLDKIILYEQKIEILTGKQSTGLHH